MSVGETDSSINIEESSEENSSDEGSIEIGAPRVIKKDDTQTSGTDEAEESETSSDEDETTDEGEETGDSDEDTDEEDTDVNKDPDSGEKLEKPAEFWNKKFRDSSKGVQDLLTKNSTLESDATGKDARITELEEENEKLVGVAKKENPEGLNLVELNKSNKDLSKQVASLKEGTELDTFIGKTKEAEPHREALKNFARAFPKKSLEDIWKDNFKAIIPSKKDKETTEEKKTTRKKDAVTETGKGTSTSEPSGETIAGVPVEKFNKLPVSKRRELLRKSGTKL